MSIRRHCDGPWCKPALAVAWGGPGVPCCTSGEYGTAVQCGGAVLRPNVLLLLTHPVSAVAMGCWGFRQAEKLRPHRTRAHRGAGPQCPPHASRAVHFWKFSSRTRAWNGTNSVLIACWHVAAAFAKSLFHRFASYQECTPPLYPDPRQASPYAIISATADILIKNSETCAISFRSAGWAACPAILVASAASEPSACPLW